MAPAAKQGGSWERRLVVHAVQLYEVDSSLLASVRNYAAEGLRNGEAVLLVISPRHHEGIRMLLQADGIDLDLARSEGRYLTFDAEGTLNSIRSGDQFDLAAFESSIVEPIRRALARHGRVRAYGEMVDLLSAREGHEAALELEELWNRTLPTLEGCRMLCSYHASERPGMRPNDLSEAFFHRLHAAHSEFVPTWHAFGGNNTAAIETMQAILAAAPALPQPDWFFMDIASEFGLDEADSSQALLVMEAAGEVLREPDGLLRRQQQAP